MQEDLFIWSWKSFQRLQDVGPYSRYCRSWTTCLRIERCNLRWLSCWLWHEMCSNAHHWITLRVLQDGRFLMAHRRLKGPRYGKFLVPPEMKSTACRIKQDRRKSGLFRRPVEPFGGQTVSNRPPCTCSLWIEHRTCKESCKIQNDGSLQNLFRTCSSFPFTLTLLSLP